MRFVLPLLFIGLCTIFFSSSITTNQVASNAILVDGDRIPALPETPYEYDDVEIPEHLMFTIWGENDPTIIQEVVTNDGATLGRVLFYDEILSANENISCGTCHKQNLSFADEDQFSQGVDVETRRNSMHLNDLGWTGNLGFFWDMSQSDLKEMIALPLQDENEIGLTDLEGVINKMNASEYYPELFENAFGDEQVTMDRIQEALMQFISAMTTFNTKLDRIQRGEEEFTPEEDWGHLLFEETCGMCHFQGNSFFFFPDAASAADNINSFPFAFTNGLPIENGDIGAGAWQENFNGLFKAPTLRNIELTAPYMHDGRFETLEEVMEHYNEGVVANDWEFLPVGGLQLNEEDTDAIIAFLKTLTDNTFTSDIKFSDPFEETIVDVEEPEELTFVAGVYPNPSNSWTTVHFENPTKFKAEVKLNNMKGQLVRKMSTNENQLAMDVSHLSPGTYFVSVNINGKIIEEKLLVQ